jgi:hypothetical protein
MLHSGWQHGTIEPKGNMKKSKLKIPTKITEPVEPVQPQTSLEKIKELAGEVHQQHREKDRLKRTQDHVNFKKIMMHVEELKIAAAPVLTDMGSVCNNLVRLNFEHNLISIVTEADGMSTLRHNGLDIARRVEPNIIRLSLDNLIIRLLTDARVQKPLSWKDQP